MSKRIKHNYSSTTQKIQKESLSDLESIGNDIPSKVTKRLNQRGFGKKVSHNSLENKELCKRPKTYWRLSTTQITTQK